MKIFKQIYRYRRLTYLILGIVTFLILYAAIYRKKHLETSDIIIKIISSNSDEKSFLEPADIKSIIAKNLSYELDGGSISGIDTYELEQILEKDPSIKDANVYIDASSKLKIKIIEREPILRIMDKNGNTYYLDKEGEYIPTSKHYTARVPVATGFIPKYKKEDLLDENSILKNLIVLGNKIDSDDFLKSLVEQVNIETNSDFVLIPKLANQKIIIGNAENLDQKFKNLRKFYEEGLSYQGWQKYSTINIKFKGQVICK